MAQSYISNENPTMVDVYFADVTITHTPTSVIQYNEYYPLGLKTASSWTRSNVTGNDFLYNEANELNKTTGWYEMFFRGYDAALGRMLQVDPYAIEFASYSTYSYSGNTPVMCNDPSGGRFKPAPDPPPPPDDGSRSSGGGGGMNSQMAMDMWGFSDTGYASSGFASGPGGFEIYNSPVPHFASKALVI